MTIQTIINYANEFATNVPWDAIVASGVLSPVILLLKKWLNIKDDKRREKVMISLVLTLSMLTAAGNYLLHVPSQDPSIIALQGAALAFMTQPVYFFIVKPAIAAFRREVEKAAQFNLDVRSAAEPPKPIAPTQEFKS